MLQITVFGQGWDDVEMVWVGQQESGGMLCLKRFCVLRHVRYWWLKNTTRISRNIRILFIVLLSAAIVPELSSPVWTLEFNSLRSLEQSINQAPLPRSVRQTEIYHSFDLITEEAL
jgi:hypothetical protein